jgi:hypothetical protein
MTVIITEWWGTSGTESASDRICNPDTATITAPA